jgi:hypothetical protein
MPDHSSTDKLRDGSLFISQYLSEFIPILATSGGQLNICGQRYLYTPKTP